MKIKEKSSNIYIFLIYGLYYTQKFILEVKPRVQLWALEKKSAIECSGQKLKKVLQY